VYRVTSGMSGESWEVAGDVLMGEGLRRVMAAGASDVLLVDPV